MRTRTVHVKAVRLGDWLAEFDGEVADLREAPDRMILVIRSNDGTEVERHRPLWARLQVAERRPTRPLPKGVLK
jgi:hypothetical protein